MSETTEQAIYEPSTETVARATIRSMAEYHALCRQADDDYEGFWGKLAQELLHWQ